MMKEIWISPSDLSYFWSDSKVGFYDKYVLEIYRPKAPFPSVFNTIDSKMKDEFNDKSILDIVVNAPSGKLIHNDLNVKSKLITIGDFKIGFKGMIDCLLEHADGSYSVIDYKTTHVSNKLDEIYFLQLMAYAYSLENPEYGTPKKINNIGLIVFEPQTFTSKLGEGSLGGSLTYVEIPFNKDKFKNWLKKDLHPLIHNDRENIFVSSNDKSWIRYVNSFYLEEDDNNSTENVA